MKCKGCEAQISLFNFNGGYCKSCKNTDNKPTYRKRRAPKYEKKVKQFHPERNVPKILHKRLKKENFRLVGECKQMSERLFNFYESSAVILGHVEAQVMCELLASQIENLSEKQIWLENNSYFPPEISEDLLALHRKLSYEIEDMEKSKKIARDIIRET